MPRTKASALAMRIKCELNSPAYSCQCRGAHTVRAVYHPTRDITIFTVAFYRAASSNQMSFVVVGKHLFSGMVEMVESLNIEYIPAIRTTVGRITLKTLQVIELRHEGTVMRCIG